MKLKCPFCGSQNTAISCSSGHDCYYKQVYCKDCHAYGPRLRISVDRSQFCYAHRYEIEHDKNLDTEAINLWNRRSN